MLDIKTLKLKILFKVNNKFTMKVEALNKMMKGINKDQMPQMDLQAVQAENIKVTSKAI